jgi:hypothetical protein
MRILLGILLLIHAESFAQFKSTGLGSYNWGTSIEKNQTQKNQCNRASIDSTIINCAIKAPQLVYQKYTPAYQNLRFQNGKLFEVNFDIAKKDFADILLALEKEFGKASIYSAPEGKTLVDGCILYIWKTKDTKIGLMFRDRENNCWINIKTTDSTLWPKGSDFEFTIEDLAIK